MKKIKNFDELNAAIAKCSKCMDAKFTGSDGKRHIVLCGGTGCLSSHSAEIKAEFEKIISEKNLGDKVTVNQVGCFGFCSQGPFVKIYPEDTLYRMVKIEDVAEIVEHDIEKGEIVDRLLYVDPSTEAKITKQDEITFYKKQVRIALHGCGSINPENIDEALGGVAAYYYFKIYKPKKEEDEDDQPEGLETDGLEEISDEEESEDEDFEENEK